MEEILFEGLKVLQNPENFCFGIDAVKLSEFAKIRDKSKVCDLCTGNGIIPLLMAKKNSASFSGIEIQAESFELAKKNIALNGFEDRIEIVNGDIKEIKKYFSPESFDFVTANPPYFSLTSGRFNPKDEKLIARHEILCNLDDVVRAASFLLKSGGSFFMIHKPERLSEIFSSMKKYRLEPKRMQFIQSFENENPNLVMIESKKNAKPHLVVEKNLIVR